MRITSILFLFLSLFLTNNNFAQDKKQKPIKNKMYKITFVELGSVKCIPCQKMQTVMKAIKEKYGKMVKIEFHDVWTLEGKPFAEQYKINLIPTQVF
ncbi:MAG: thioredoxin family protein [Candidatus Kapaibacteriales bacterium]